MKTYQTIVAFDIHPTRIGYAALFRGRVVDCGVTRLRRDHLQTSKHLRHLVEELCRLWQPAVAIVQTSRRNRGRHTGVIRRALAGEGIPTRRVPARARQGGSPTKYEMASDLARRFPELNRLLPRKRRLWDPEDDRLHIFTAVGLAILFSPRTGKKEIQKIGQVAE